MLAQHGHHSVRGPGRDQRAHRSSAAGSSSGAPGRVPSAAVYVNLHDVQQRLGAFATDAQRVAFDPRPPLIAVQITIHITAAQADRPRPVYPIRKSRTLRPLRLSICAGLINTRVDFFGSCIAGRSAEALAADSSRDPATTSGAGAPGALRYSTARAFPDNQYTAPRLHYCWELTLIKKQHNLRVHAMIMAALLSA